MFRFYTSENVWKLLAFSRFPGYRNETLAWNELTEWRVHLNHYHWFLIAIVIQKQKRVGRKNDAWNSNFYHHNEEAYSEPCQTTEMKLFAKKVNSWKPLTIIAKISILDVLLGSE